MSSQSQQNCINNAASINSLSFDEIAKHFCLPLSDAAALLGVCSSVLKKICHENGLDRWPYRKFLAGKSIEEIKRYAAKQKHRELAASNVRQSSQPQNHEISKSQGARPVHALQQEGNQGHAIGKSNIWLNTSLTKAMKTLDEFKYGFPSGGLSTVTNKWWGSYSADEDIDEYGDESFEEDKHPFEEKANDGADSMEVEKKEDGEIINKVASKGSGSLLAIRRRIMEEGREALKLGVYRGYGSKKLSNRQRTLLVQIFKSSLPNEWTSESS